MLSIINTADSFNRRALVNDNMDCIFSPDDIDNLPQPSDLITKDGLTALFAKMLAATVLTREYPFAPRMTSDLVDGKVLWIDSVNSFQATAQLAKDMKQLCNANASNFRIAALTALGTGQEFYETTRDTIIHAINDFVPHLVIINNLDKLFPYAGHGFAFGFVEYLRDFVAAHDSAVCAIGHNLIGKVKKTTGPVGEILYPIACTVYKVGERSKKESAITRVSCYKTFQRCPQDFAFTINDFNFPQQVGSEQEPDTQQLSQQPINQVDKSD